MYLLLCILAFNFTTKEIFTEEFFAPLNPVADSQNPSLLLEEYSIKSMVDAGCGANPLIPANIRYLGVDIVDAIEGAHFDITKEVLPQSDLILCQNTLNFFSYRNIVSTLQKFKESQSRYLILNTSEALEKNQETTTGIYREINFELSPFSFPPPLSRDGQLAIWELSAIDPLSIENDAFPPVTILTKPVGGTFRAAHAGVVNSALKGLQRVANRFNYNPDDFNEVNENVVVITDERAGKQAYEWKKEGKIKTLTAGPNFAPSEGNAFITWPHLNCYFSNSQWPAVNIIQMHPFMKDRIRIWYAGVDEAFWKPRKKFREKESNKVLLYCKTDGHISAQAKICLQEFGYEVISLGYYGSSPYSLETFRDLLEQCKFAVFVSRSESQGIALAEAWSMDVPVLAWNPQAPFDWDGHTWTDVSSCPYMNPMVGLDWKEIDQFKEILQSFDALSQTFHPRRWVLLNMTDQTSIERLFCHIREFIIQTQNN